MGVDVDLELVDCREPGFSRRPDLVVVGKDAVDRVSAEGGLLRAAEVIIAVEIVAPDSRRIDTVDKRGEYAEAGIPWYWIIDIDEPRSLTAYRNAAEQQRATGTFTTEEPFPIRLELDRLL
jgi:Uma2 family endonuclease